ncbi:hypothetical protein KC347_g5257 [Hortaea werneckii]|nr:hypothetical protein KC347_g5257 [Hortaea werneckii]
MTRSSIRLNRKLVPYHTGHDNTESDPYFEAFNIAKMPDDNVPSIKEALQKCFETGEYADMTITCSGRTWHVHKVVVCSQVPFFAKAVTGKFKEARDSCIDLVDDDPSAVGAMLRYLYFPFHFDEFKQLDIGELLFLARCYKLADKYLLAELRTMAGQKLRATLIECKWEVKDLLALVEELFAGADESSKAAPELLRTWAIAATYLNYILCFHSSPSHIRFREVAFSRPDFLMGVMDIFQEQNPSLGGYLLGADRLFPFQP